jgi:hypothetical protein
MNVFAWIVSAQQTINSSLSARDNIARIRSVFNADKTINAQHYKNVGTMDYAFAIILNVQHQKFVWPMELVDAKTRPVLTT